MDLPTYQPGDKVTYRRTTTGGLNLDVEATVIRDVNREILVEYNGKRVWIFKTSVTIVG